MKKLIAIFTLCLLSSFAFSAGPAASIEQLDWIGLEILVQISWKKTGLPVRATRSWLLYE